MNKGKFEEVGLLAATSDSLKPIVQQLLDEGWTEEEIIEEYSQAMQALDRKINVTVARLAAILLTALVVIVGIVAAFIYT